MATITSNKTVRKIFVQNKDGKTVQLSDQLTGKVNLLHFQNSHRAGQSCRVVMPIIEEHLEQLRQYGEPIVIVREEPMDQENPASTPVTQLLMSKTDLATLGVLGEDTYIRRTSFIVAKDGTVLVELGPVSQEELAAHIPDVVLPKLAELA